ncbi:MAG: hypothetical protein AB7S74_08490 [Hyphomicrobium sp.]
MRFKAHAFPLSAIVIALAALGAHTTTALAKTCASETVEARGEPSRYLWLAKTKTRANWRRKVRSIPELGSDYANWARAENTEEKCYSGPSGHLCIFSGTPCLP